MYKIYETGNGKRWRVEDWEGMEREIGLAEEDLADFHAAMAIKERAWVLIRLRFGIAPMVGETDVDYFSPHAPDWIGNKFGISASDVNFQLAEVKSYFARWRMSQADAESEARSAEDVKPLGKDEVKRLLELAGYLDGGESLDESERRFIAGRARDLKGKLEDEEGRTIAQRAIRTEVELMGMDIVIADIRKEMRGDKVSSTRKSELREELREQTSLKEKVYQSYLKTMEALEATQAQRPTVRKRQEFQDSVGGLIQAIQAYKARGDRSLVDGVFTASEVQVLVQPTELRESQYRPDLVALINDAMRSENLWDPNYVPPAMDRESFRRLRRAWSKAVEDSFGIASVEDASDEADPGAEEALAASDSETPGVSDAISDDGKGHARALAGAIVDRLLTRNSDSRGKSTKGGVVF